MENNKMGMGRSEMDQPKVDHFAAPVQAQKMVELGSRCPECGAGIIRLTERQRNSLKVAIAALRGEGFEVQLVRMYQAEPVTMVMMITPPTDGSRYKPTRSAPNLPSPDPDLNNTQKFGFGG